MGQSQVAIVSTTTRSPISLKTPIATFEIRGKRIAPSADLNVLIDQMVFLLP